MKTNKIAIAAITAVGLVAPLGLSMGAAHADSDMGYLIGTVTDSAGHPVANADVEADGSGISYNVSSGTDRNGRYVIAFDSYDLTNGGTWTISASADGLMDSTAQPVTAPGIGQNAGGPTISLASDTATPPTSGVVLTGGVTTPNGPAHSGSVIAYDAATGRDVDSTNIEPNGSYYFTGSSTPGDYGVTGRSVKLLFSVGGYLESYNGGGLSQKAAPAIAVPALGQAPASVNGAVTAKGTIVGAVKLPAAGANWGASVTIYDTDGNEVTGRGNNADYNNPIYGSSAYGGTDAAGNFSVDVPPGTYYVRADGSTWKNFTPAGSTTPSEYGDYNFVAGYYGKKATSLATAKKLVVGANAVKSVGTITLTNAYHATEKPFITAKKGLKKGAKVKVGHGAWNHNVATTFTYTWKVGKKTIGHKATLKLTKKVWKKKLKNGKKIKKLTVTVTANDKYGYLVSGSSKQKVVKALAKEQKAAQKAVKKAQKQAKKVENKTKH